MKLVRYGHPGSERPAILSVDGHLYDLSVLISDIGPDQLNPASLRALSFLSTEGLPRLEGRPRIAPPISQIGKIICVGLNYAEHAFESGAPLPKEPILFLKAPSAVVGAYDNVILPNQSIKSDWEVELGVVIGSVAASVSVCDALDYVAGYTIVNDISEREFQLERGGLWDKGKSCDTFCPVGPWLVTKDEIKDPQCLSLWLDVNGRRLQSSSTKHMIFGVKELVSYISHFMTLYPGDLVSTGTPPGVGLGQKPQPWYLSAGDEMTLGIDGLGIQRQHCRRAEPPSSKMTPVT